MAEAISSASSIPASAARADFSNPSYQAYQIMHLGFVVAPVVAGNRFLVHAAFHA